MIKEPLLQNKNQNSQGGNLLGSKQIGKKNPLANIMAKKMTKAVKNEIKEPVRLPVNLKANFIEENVHGVQYEKLKEEEHHAWDTNKVGFMNNAKTIFQGIRTPYFQVVNENNMITEGQVTEQNGIIYIGCKDGAVKVCNSNEILNTDLELKHDATIKSFQAYEGKKVRDITCLNDFLITRNGEKNMTIWNVLNYIQDQQIFKPLDVKQEENVVCFDPQIVNGKSVLYYFQDGFIKSVHLKDNREAVEYKPPIEIQDISCAMFKVYKDQTILLADKDKDANIYLINIENSNVTKTQILCQKDNHLGKAVKGLYYKDGEATIVYTNLQNNNTVVTTVNLELLHQEEEEQIKKEEERKRQEENDKQKKEQLDEDEYKLYKIQMQKAQEQIEQQEKEQKEKENKETALINTTYEIGGCYSIDLSKSKNQQEQELVVTGESTILILSGERWQNILFQIKVDYTLVWTIFSEDGKSIFSVGNDGILRIIEWKKEQDDGITYFEESEIEDTIASHDGKHFATLSNNQSKVQVYSYEDCQVIDTYQNMNNTYLMRFTADSNALICVQGTDIEKVFNIILIKIQKEIDGKVTVITCEIEDDFIAQVDASIYNEEIYMITKNINSQSQSLHVYGFNTRCKNTIRDATSLAVSTDEKLLAYSNSSKQVFMVFIKDLEEAQTLKSASSMRMSFFNKKGRSQSFKKKKIPKDETQVKVVNTIDLEDNALSIQFNSKNQKIVIQTSVMICGMDIFTHETQFKIQSSASQSPFRKVQLLFEDYLCFVDAGSHLCVYDINYKLEMDYANIISKSLKKNTLKINEKHSQQHAAWACAGNHIIMQLHEQLVFQSCPFLHYNVSNELAQTGPFTHIEGLYLPTLIGGPRIGTGQFSELFQQAISDKKVDIELLRLPIYPYKLNALHYFAMTSNVAGAQICFENKVKFTLDVFGKSPLDYAIETKDKLIIETVLNGIYNTENEERTRIMRSLPLSLLIEHTAPVLANMLSQGGAAVPLEGKFGQEMKIPTLFPLEETTFSESGIPVYSVCVAQQLHPPGLIKKEARYRAISTYVMNNPVPRNFTDDSLKLLSCVCECGNDDIVRSKPITLFLNRKWNSYAYSFYLFQFAMFITNLLSLTFIEGSGNAYVEKTCQSLSVAINTYFLLFEIIQMAIQKFDYFASLTNLLDLLRLAAIYIYLCQNIFHWFEIPKEVVPIIFMFMWFKILSYLSVFKPTRYLIKMTFEIINDITTFLIILFTALFAYAQICYVIDGDETVDTELRLSYGLALGELGEITDFSVIKFLFFVLFSFFIPLVLLNMLIALMADSYTRVQSNAVAADARALAEMELEMEEVVQFLIKVFGIGTLEKQFYYCFTSMLNDEEAEEDWEGTVGQLKRTIEDATGELETKLISTIEGLTKRSTDKIVEQLLKASNSELETMSQIQSQVDKESQSIKQYVETQVLDESHKVSEQFKTTQKQMGQYAQKSDQNFKETHDKMSEQHTEVKTEFQKTQELMEQESKKTEANFNKTHEQVNQESKEIKESLGKTQQSLENETQLIKGDIKSTQEKLDTQSSDIKSEVNKANDKITDVNCQVMTTSSQINENVNSSSAMTKEELFKNIKAVLEDVMSKIDKTSESQTQSVQSQVSKQSDHHQEMVDFTTNAQKQIDQMLQNTHSQQVKLFELVDEIKGVQSKELEQISSQGQELENKKKFENQQRESVSKIQEVLTELKSMEEEKSQQYSQDKKSQDERSQKMQEELSKINNLAQFYEEIQSRQDKILQQLQEFQEQTKKKDESNEEFRQNAKANEDKINEQFQEIKNILEKIQSQ